MRLPTPLLRRKSNTHKNQFGHVLVLAGSARMLGAGALSSLAALRAGAGLVTLGIPKSLNTAAQKKIHNEIMTLPLNETKAHSLAASAFLKIRNAYAAYSAIAIGPGMSQDTDTQRFIRRIIATSPLPLVIDADALNTLKDHLSVLKKNKTAKILTPHPGEMARLIGQSKKYVEAHRQDVATRFADRYNCVLLLKGSKTVVAETGHSIYTNSTGNAGMSTAGSGDVLTGMIAAFLAQGLSAFDAAKFGAYLHGKAGDIAARHFTKTAMIASDIIACIPRALKTNAYGK